MESTPIQSNTIRLSLNNSVDFAFSPRLNMGTRSKNQLMISIFVADNFRKRPADATITTEPGTKKPFYNNNASKSIAL